MLRAASSVGDGNKTRVNSYPDTATAGTYHEHVSVYCVSRPKTVVISHSATAGGSQLAAEGGGIKSGGGGGNSPGFPRDKYPVAAANWAAAGEEKDPDLASTASGYTYSIPDGMDTSYAGSVSRRDSIHAPSVSSPGALAEGAVSTASPLSKQDWFAFLAGIFATVVVYEFLGRTWLAIIFTLLIAGAVIYIALTVTGRILAAASEISHQRATFHEAAARIPMGGGGGSVENLNSTMTDNHLGPTPHHQ